MPNDINNSFDSSRLSHHTDRTTPVEHLSQKTLEPIDHNIKNAYITQYNNCETFDESDDSYEFIEIIA